MDGPFSFCQDGLALVPNVPATVEECGAGCAAVPGTKVCIFSASNQNRPGPICLTDDRRCCPDATSVLDDACELEYNGDYDAFLVCQD